jgi:DNA-binding HxlR family transcriptional regulator
MNKQQIPYDIYDDRCPTRDVLSRLADKWALLVLGCLERGPHRFNNLRRSIRGITQKMLTQTLRKLERDGLVSREIFPTVPVTVEYSLSPLGKTLTQTVSLLTLWVEDNMDAMSAAQTAYDTANAVE